MTQQEIQKQIERLQKARSKAEELSREKSRLSGELGALEKQKKDLEDKCVQEFDCDISELPEMIDAFMTEAEVALNNAEVILGLKVGTIQKVVTKTKQSDVDEDSML
jgi:predicted  nucleic acid-binding Zn-ribbon protein